MYPDSEISITLLDIIIGERYGVSDYTIANVKKKLVQFSFMKPSATFPGMWVIITKGEAKKDPEKEVDELLGKMHESN